MVANNKSILSLIFRGLTKTLQAALSLCVMKIGCDRMEAGKNIKQHFENLAY